MEIGTFGIHKQNPDRDRRDPTLPPVRMALSGYAAGIVHIFGQPHTHHKLIDLENDKLVVLADFKATGQTSSRYYYRAEIENGEKFYPKGLRGDTFIKDDAGPDSAEVEVEASGYGGQYYEATVTLPGRWEKKPQL